MPFVRTKDNLVELPLATFHKSMLSVLLMRAIRELGDKHVRSLEKLPWPKSHVVPAKLRAVLRVLVT